MSGTNPFSFTSPMTSTMPFSFSSPGGGLPMPGSMPFTAQSITGIAQPMFGQGLTIPSLPGFPGTTPGISSPAFPSLTMPQAGGSVVSSFGGMGSPFVSPDSRLRYESSAGIPPIIGVSVLPGTASLPGMDELLKLRLATQSAAQPVLGVPGPVAPPAAAPAAPGFDFGHFATHTGLAVFHGFAARYAGPNIVGAGSCTELSFHAAEAGKDLKEPLESLLKGPVANVLKALGEEMQKEQP